MPPRKSTTSSPASGPKSKPRTSTSSAAGTAKPRKAPKKQSRPPSTPASASSTRRRQSTSTAVSYKEDDEEEEQESSSDDGDASDGYQGSDAMSEEEEEEEEAVDSDNLDESSDDAAPSKGSKKRKSTGGGSKNGSAKKKGKAAKKDDSEDESEGEYEVGGKNTRVVFQEAKVKAPKADPKTHIILPTTLSFLRALRDNNDREWFSVHDAEYRHALLNWTTFVTKLVPVVSKVDWTVPELPVKDLLHRIYRDVRFSKSKIPYKTNLAASFSRTGRKSPFSLYYMHISPQNRTVLAAGKWCPAASELSCIRSGFLRDPKPFRKIINGKRFQELFGSAEGRGKKGRGNVYGHEDELKNAPKLPNVTKDHPDIDLLKLRSVAVETHFTDEQVVAENFMEVLEEALEVVMPFVQCINEMISPTPESDDDGNGHEGGGDGDDDDEEAQEVDENEEEGSEEGEDEEE